jgi:predicted secreted protein
MCRLAISSVILGYRLTKEGVVNIQTRLWPVLLALVLAFSGCGDDSSNPASSGSQEIAFVLTEADTAEMAVANVGDVFRVVLTLSSGTPYYWRSADPIVCPPLVLLSQEEVFEPPEPEEVGWPYEIHWSFGALSAGERIMAFEMYRPFDPDVVTSGLEFRIQVKNSA